MEKSDSTGLAFEAKMQCPIHKVEPDLTKFIWNGDKGPSQSLSLGVGVVHFQEHYQVAKQLRHLIFIKANFSNKHFL